MPPCHQPASGLGRRLRRHDGPVIALAGNPNVGKSTIFNRLTGLHVTTAHYPGTTVEVAVGTAHLDGTRATVVDLPGSYGLGGASEDQLEARRALLERSTGRRRRHPGRHQPGPQPLPGVGVARPWDAGRGRAESDGRGGANRHSDQRQAPERDAGGAGDPHGGSSWPRRARPAGRRCAGGTARARRRAGIGGGATLTRTKDEAGVAGDIVGEGSRRRLTT